VGPEFSITFTNSDGSPVTHVDPGTYEIVVRDLSDFHNFHLSGPGVNESTGVEAIGNVTWTVTFQDGRYSVVCDPHASQLHREFTAGTPPPLTPPPKPTPKLLATCRAEEHDLAEERERSDAEDGQGRHLLDHLFATARSCTTSTWSARA
jgi:hypothetical protein